MKRLYVEVMLFLWSLLHTMMAPVRAEAIRRAEATPEFRAWHDENIRPFACLAACGTDVSRESAQPVRAGEFPEASSSSEQRTAAGCAARVAPAGGVPSRAADPVRV